MKWASFFPLSSTHRLRMSSPTARPSHTCVPLSVFTLSALRVSELFLMKMIRHDCPFLCVSLLLRLCRCHFIRSFHVGSAGERVRERKVILMESINRRVELCEPSMEWVKKNIYRKSEIIFIRSFFMCKFNGQFSIIFSKSVCASRPFSLLRPGHRLFICKCWWWWNRANLLVCKLLSTIW